MSDQPSYHEMFAVTHGLGPWNCYFCGRIVRRSQLHRHHVNHCHEDNRPENLVPSHARCHQKHHGRSPAHEKPFQLTIVEAEEYRPSDEELRALGIPPEGWPSWEMWDETLEIMKTIDFRR